MAQGDNSSVAQGLRGEHGTESGAAARPGMASEEAQSAGAKEKFMAEMTERPILFSGEMVKAILAGRKTQTRRVVKPQPINPIDGPGFSPVELNWRWDSENARVCPYGVEMDLLWVRETWRCDDEDNLCGHRIRYESDGKTQWLWPDTDFRKIANPTKKRPSIFMPRWASRITLEVTGVRVERVRSISEEDAIAEGVEPELDWTATMKYAVLWDKINGKKYPWANNPFVWVIEFKRLESR